MDAAPAAGAPRRRLPFETHGYLIVASVWCLGVIAFGVAVHLQWGGLADFPALFFLVPVIASGIVFGVRGGAVAAALASALTVAGSDLASPDLVSRVVAFLLAGLLVGVFSSGRRELVASLSDALARSQALAARLNMVAESVADGLVTIDEHGTVLGFNTAAERIFGYEHDEVAGRNVTMLMRDEDRAGHSRELGHSVDSGAAKIVGAGPREVIGKAKDGSVFPMELSIGEAVDDGQRIFIGALRDITERKQREDEEYRARSLLEQLVVDRTSDLRERSTELDAARIETLGMLALAGEYRDDQTFEHAARVGETSARIGELLGLDEPTVSAMRQAAPLHDIGKLAVPDIILLHPGSLTELQRAQMKIHALAGHRLLAQSHSDVLMLASEIALTHHEWWDGTGYPNGLEGGEIPLSGRITAIADVFDALTHARPYKRAWTVEQAADEIRSLSGRQFDPRAVEAFLHLDLAALAAGRTGLPDGRLVEALTAGAHSHPNARCG